MKKLLARLRYRLGKAILPPNTLEGYQELVRRADETIAELKQKNGEQRAEIESKLAALILNKHELTTARAQLQKVLAAPWHPSRFNAAKQSFREAVDLLRCQVFDMWTELRPGGQPLHERLYLQDNELDLWMKQHGKSRTRLEEPRPRRDDQDSSTVL